MIGPNAEYTKEGKVMEFAKSKTKEKYVMSVDEASLYKVLRKAKSSLIVQD